jgi:cysteine synthase A
MSSSAPKTPAALHPSQAILSLIGNTPLVPLHFEPEGVTIYAKAEFVNPSGSIKDRFAKCLLLDARNRGCLRPDSIIVECSSGNTGIALSMLGTALGYFVRILMSASASEERRKLICQLGAELVLFESAESYQTGIDLSREMAAADPRVFLPRQFENPVNACDHEHGTGQEILRQIPRPIDAFVSGFGTGGTLAGCGRAIKTRWPLARIVALEPGGRSLLAGECPCCQVIEGVAEGFVPALLRDAPIDERIEVNGADAMAITRRLHREFGLLVGTPSGANVLAALQTARQLGPDPTVVTILCDRAERYFSTALFDREPPPLYHTPHASLPHRESRRHQLGPLP